MTSQEINDIIASKAAAYGFEKEKDTFNIARTTDSYIGFQIYAMPNYDKTDFENKIYCMDVIVSAAVCKMNQNADAEELLQAADEIRRGALLARELQDMKLSFIKEV
ncbi:MAG: hypothetical protein IJ521_12635 [Schwartzia sp.]|nr:hypothetical protein [Schwartzia sp. (in: firmicutes)]